MRTYLDFPALASDPLCEQLRPYLLGGGRPQAVAWASTTAYIPEGRVLCTGGRNLGMLQ